MVTKKELEASIAKSIDDASRPLPRGPSGVRTVEDALQFLHDFGGIPEELTLEQYHDLSDATIVLNHTHDLRLALKFIEAADDASDLSMRDGLLPLLEQCEQDRTIHETIRQMLHAKTANKIEWMSTLADTLPSDEFVPDLVAICLNDDYDSDAQDRAFLALETISEASDDTSLMSRVDEFRKTRFRHLT